MAHRRRQIADQAGPAAPLGLHAFTHHGDPIGINIGRIVNSQLRVAGSRQTGAFSGKPFQRTMGADMHHSVRFPDIAQPVIIPQIMMRWRAVRGMVNFPRIFAETARRLDGNKDVAVLHTGNQQHIVIVKNISRRFAPVAPQLLLRFFFQRNKKAAVVFVRKLAIRFSHLLFRHITAIIGRMRNQFVHEDAAVFRNAIYHIPFLLHLRQKQANAFRRI